MVIVHLGKTCRPMPCGEGQGVFNTLACDPAKFTSLLCLHLGIATNKGDRLAEMNAVIASHVRVEDFFFRSYSVDPIGVCHRLLALIDEISLGGGLDFHWRAFSGVSRISQLARIAIQLDNRAPLLSLSDQLRRIISVIRESGAPIPIAGLVLSEPPDSWPHMWRVLFDALAANGCDISCRKTTVPSDSMSDLGRVTQRLLTKSVGEKLDFMGDQSILWINGSSVLEVADAVAALVEWEQKENHSLAIVRSDEWNALDAAFARQNLPALGTSRADRGLGPVEILPLILDLISGPPDPLTFLAFLSVDPHPLPISLRLWLIRELNEKSGVDSDNMCSIVDQYVAKIGEEKIGEQAEVWKRWLRVQGHSALVTLESMEPVLDRIENWAAVSSSMPGNSDVIRMGFGTLIANAKALRHALAPISGSGLTRIQLQSIVAKVLSPARLVTHREQSRVVAVEHPAALASATDTIIWWMAHDISIQQGIRPIWTNSERQELANLGVELQNLGIVAQESYAAAIRLLALAKKRIIFVTVDRIGDEPVSVHPLWYEVEESFSNMGRPTRQSVQNLWISLVLVGRKDIESIDSAAQMPFQTRWEIPEAAYATRAYESPSSLEKMLGCPLAWSLQYRAGLYDGSTYRLADGFLLLGILAHACFEAFFKTGAWTYPQSESESAAKQIFEHCLRTHAGILLTPGRDRERLEAEAKTIAGMLDLGSKLVAGGWEFVGAEESVESKDMVHPMRGRLDLLFRRVKKTEERLIVDVKYVGKRRRQQEIQRGVAIQLATYSRILREGESWPKTAYYIVFTKDLLTAHADVASGFYSINGEHERDIWSRIEAATNATTARLAKGIVDVGLDEENPQVLVEAGRLVPAPCKYCDFRLFCRTHRRSA